MPALLAAGMRHSGIGPASRRQYEQSRSVTSHATAKGTGSPAAPPLAARAQCLAARPRAQAARAGRAASGHARNGSLFTPSAHHRKRQFLAIRSGLHNAQIWSVSGAPQLDPAAAHIGGNARPVQSRADHARYLAGWHGEALWHAKTVFWRLGPGCGVSEAWPCRPSPPSWPSSTSPAWQPSSWSASPPPQACTQPSQARRRRSPHLSAGRRGVRRGAAVRRGHRARPGPHPGRPPGPPRRGTARGPARSGPPDVHDCERERRGSTVPGARR